MDGWRRNSWLDIENGSLEFLNEWFESPPRWCNCIRVVFVGTNRRIRGGTCCGKIKKRARKPCPSSLLEFRRGGNGIRIIFLRFFLYGKWMVGRRHWIEASKILKDVETKVGWKMEDVRRVCTRYWKEGISNRCIDQGNWIITRERKMDSCSWLLRDWKFLKMSTKIGRERVIEVYTNVLDIGRGHLQYIVRGNWKIIYEGRMNVSWRSKNWIYRKMSIEFLKER